MRNIPKYVLKSSKCKIVMYFINNWDELAQVEDSEAHTLEIEDHNGWIVNKDTKEHVEYLSTHTFYGNFHEHRSALLQRYGFNVQLKNWDA